MLHFLLILFILCACTTPVIGQFSHSTQNLLGSGISIQGGPGHLAIRDQYISDQKYSGTVTAFNLSWLRGDTSFAYRLGLDYCGSTEIRNNNVSAQVLQTGLNLDFLHFIGRFPVFAREAFSFVGPSAAVFLYYRQQHIATGGNAFFNAYSFALFVSFDVNSTVVVPLCSDVSAEGSARLALLSIGGRLADLHDANVSFFKVVSAFSGIRGRTEILLRYALSDVFLLKSGYRFEVCQSTSWDYLLSASDQLVFSVTVQI